ncbi:MAG: serine/threonine-protein phosphatase, partial [Spirochaetes bacterium]|nr:serine/threonine-protein phosphatase [Spirochaetota bacterium]
AAFSGVAYAVLLATGYLLSEDYRAAALVLVRLAAAGAVTSYLAFFRLAVGYPYAKRLVALDVALAAVAGAALWALVFTDAYLVDLKRFGYDFVRFEGSYHAALSIAGAGIGAAAAVTMAARAAVVSSRVYRQHLAVMALGLAGSVAWGYALAIVAPTSTFLMGAYPLSAANALFSVLAASYAFSATRVFQARAAVKAVAAWAVILLAFGLPLGAAVGMAFLLRGAAPATAVLLAAVGFAAAGHWAESFAKGRLGSGHDEASREDLEAAIAHLDLSTGRESVLGELSGIMGDAFGCSWFATLSEDDSGGLRRIYPEDDDALVAAPGSPALEALAALERRVVFKTDVVADEAFAEQKPALLAFFEALGAEAVVLAKEGRRVVGAFAFGPKRSGADYDALDYAAFDAVHGKLFVVAYYARHVARESLLETVEQEIGLADQIVRSIQQHIDPIAHPGVSVSFRCESPRGLGGDLFDSVRISEHRWFFVVGDISGKGLNASMSMVILKSMIRTLLKEEKDFVKLVSRTNAFIKERLPRGTFFSGLFGFLALDKGSVYFINCGIPAMFFRSPGLDSAVEAQGDGKMLGFVKNVEPFLKTRKLALPPGSRLLICTDGIVEAESVRGERYGKERLARILGENKGSSAAETVDAVVKSASAFAGGRLDDDITVVAIDYEGLPKEKKR